MGFIYIGPISDFGYNFARDQGRIALQTAFRGKVYTEYVENVAETDNETVCENFVSTDLSLDNICCE